MISPDISFDMCTMHSLATELNIIFIYASKLFATRKNVNGMSGLNGTLTI